MNAGKDRLTISLVAHTNVGKTTLARTLLRKDVGEVRDRAHVTEVSEAYPLIETDDARLFLWDTPGLGDTVRLVRRLKREGSPVGWFLHQVWDKHRDRPLWCSQEALRNVREDADVVLYLVNAGESPEDAGYVPLELEILDWIGRPTLVVLNQTGGTEEASRKLTAEWEAYLADQRVVRGVLALDAFTRSWLQEDALFERLVPLFPADRRDAMASLAAAWSARNRAIFEQTTERIAAFLVEVANDGERVDEAERRSPLEVRARVEAFLGRIEERERALWEGVVDLHGLEGDFAVEARSMLESLVPGIETFGLVEQLTQLLDENKNTMKGAAGGLVAVGLAADVLSGGLTLGGGALVGGLLGGALGRLMDRRRGKTDREDRETLRLSAALLARLVVDCLCRYLVLAHHGRGRGALESNDEASRYRAAVEAALEAEDGRLVERLESARSGSAARSAEALTADLARIAESLLGRG